MAFLFSIFVERYRSLSGEFLRRHYTDLKRHYVAVVCKGKGKAKEDSVRARLQQECLTRAKSIQSKILDKQCGIACGAVRDHGGTLFATDNDCSSKRNHSEMENDRMNGDTDDDFSDATNRKKRRVHQKDIGANCSRHLAGNMRHRFNKTFMSSSDVSDLSLSSDSISDRSDCNPSDLSSPGESELSSLSSSPSRRRFTSDDNFILPTNLLKHFD
jgi:hypothetical protein